MARKNRIVMVKRDMTKFIRLPNGRTFTHDIKEQNVQTYQQR